MASRSEKDAKARLGRVRPDNSEDSGVRTTRRGGGQMSYEPGRERDLNIGRVLKDNINMFRKGR